MWWLTKAWFNFRYYWAQRDYWLLLIPFYCQPCPSASTSARSRWTNCRKIANPQQEKAPIGTILIPLYYVEEDLLLFGPSFNIRAVLEDFVSPHLFTFEHQARPGLPTQQGPAWWLEGGFHQPAWLSVHALASKWEGLWNSIQMGLKNWNTPKI